MTEQTTNITIVTYGVEEYAPFRAMKESLNTVKHSFGGRIQIQYVDIWDHPECVISLGFIAIPATVLYLNGEPALWFSGYNSPRQIAKRIAVVLQDAGDSHMPQELEQPRPITRLLLALRTESWWAKYVRR